MVTDSACEKRYPPNTESWFGHIVAQSRFKLIGRPPRASAITIHLSAEIHAAQTRADIRRQLANSE